MKIKILKILTHTTLLSISWLVAGCSETNSSEPGGPKMEIEGFVYNSTSLQDIFKSGYAVSQAQVDAYQVNEQGDLEKVNKNSAVTDSRGKYELEADVINNKPYFIAARKHDKCWKAILSNATFQNDIRIFAQPLTNISTAQAIVYQNAIKNHYNLSVYDISLLVDEVLSSMMISNPDIIEETTELINKSVNGRASAIMNSYFGGTEKELQRFYKSAEEINLLFSRDIHFAVSADDITTLIDDYYGSYMDLFLNAGISKDKVLKLLEVYYRIIVLSEDSNDESKLNLHKSSAYLKALVFNNSILSDFNSLQGSRQVENIKSAAKILNESIKSASNHEKIKNSFKVYNNKVMENLLEATGINIGLKKSIEKRILTDRNKLYSDLDRNSDPQSIINAYVKYYSSVLPDLKKLLKNLYNEESDLIADMIVLLYINV